MTTLIEFTLPPDALDEAHEWVRASLEFLTAYADARDTQLARDGTGKSAFVPPAANCNSNSTILYSI